jgi:cellulose synthase operon protein B
MRFAGYALVALFCATLSWSATAVARAGPALATPSPTASPSEDLPFDDPIARPQGAIALSHLYPLPGPVRLRGDMASFDISIPLVRTAVLQAASVELHYTNSIALLTARSVLAVRFNETTLAQIHLDAAASVGVVTVNLPISLWRPGYNKLTIDVVQHYIDRCEDPNAPELWTEVDLFRSRLHYKVAPSSAPYLLSDLSSIFAPGLGGQSQVLLMTAPTPQADKLRSQALPFVAQALALRRQYAALTIEQASWSAGGEGNPSHLPDDAAAHLLHVLVGTPDQLASLLTSSPLPPIDGPKLLVANIGDGRGRLIVTGRSPDEVIVASHNLAVLQDTLTPDTQAVFIPGQSPTRTMPLDGRSFLVGNTTYSFNALGVSTTTIQGSGKNRITVPLPLPGDYYTSENAQAALLLNFAYSAAMGAGSVINIRLNGEFIQGIFFNNTNGQRFTGYRLNVPVRLLRPGSNTLDFDVSTHPFHVGAECTSQRGDDLFVQVMGSSTIRLPPAGHAAVLPDLVRLAAAGFPYVAGDGSAAGKIYVSSPELAGAALTLIGKMAQTVRGPVSGWEIIVAPATAIKGQAIVLATADQLSPDYYAELSTAVARTKRWPYHALQDLRTVSNQPGLTLGNLWSAIFGRAAPPAQFPATESLTQRSALGDLGVLFTLRNPHGAGDDTLTILTADTNAILAHRVHALVQPELWSQMRGDLLAWRTPDAPVFTMAVADHYVVGKEDPWLLLRLTVSTNPLYWLAAAALAAALATAAAFILLGLRRKRLPE